jgi:hypothetical protein
VAGACPSFIASTLPVVSTLIVCPAPEPNQWKTAGPSAKMTTVRSDGCSSQGLRDNHLPPICRVPTPSADLTDPQAYPFDELGPVVAAAAKEISSAFGSPES